MKQFEFNYKYERKYIRFPKNNWMFKLNFIIIMIYKATSR